MVQTYVTIAGTIVAVIVALLFVMHKKIPLCLFVWIVLGALLWPLVLIVFIVAAIIALVVTVRLTESRQYDSDIVYQKKAVSAHRR